MSIRRPASKRMSELTFEYAASCGCAQHDKRVRTEAQRARAAEKRLQTNVARLREELKEAIASRDEWHALYDEATKVVARLKDEAGVARSMGLQLMKDSEHLQTRSERAEAELVRLREEAGRLHTALAPFARAWNEQEPDDQENDALEMHVQPSDCRKAAEVLDAGGDQ